MNEWLYNEIFFNAKKKWAIKLWRDMAETWMHITKWKKPICKPTYSMSPTVWCPGKGKTV